MRSPRISASCTPDIVSGDHLSLSPSPYQLSDLVHLPQRDHLRTTSGRREESVRSHASRASVQPPRQRESDSTVADPNAAIADPYGTSLSLSLSLSRKSVPRVMGPSRAGPAG